MSIPFLTNTTFSAAVTVASSATAANFITTTDTGININGISLTRVSANSAIRVGNGLETLGLLRSYAGLAVGTSAVIGSSSQSNTLTVSSSQGSRNTRFLSAGNGGYVEFSSSNDGIYGYIGTGSHLLSPVVNDNDFVIRAENEFAVSIGATEKFRINSSGNATFAGLASGITPVAAANFVTKAYVDGSGGGTGPFLPLAGGTLSGNLTITKSSATMKVSEAGGGDIRMVAGGATGYIGTYNNASLQIVQNTGTAVIIDTSRNVGIGTTSPNAKLDVESTASNYIARFSHSTATGFAPGSILLEAGQGNSRGQGLYHYNTVADENWFTGVPYNVSSKKWIVANKNSAVQATDTAQLTHALMTIDSDTGNVGIGTTSPAAKLQVEKTDSGEGLRIDGAGGGFALLVNGGTSYKTSIKNASIGNGYGGNTAPANGLIVEGNVGIGTTSPTQKLHVDGNALISAEKYYYTAGTGAGFGSDSNGNFKIRQNDADLIFGSGNNVGIGTTNPSTKLHVVGSAGEFALTLQNTGNGDGLKVLTANQTANNGFLWNQGSSNLVNMYSSSTTNASKMIMLAGNVDKIFFNTEGNSFFNGGNLGIGETNPSGNLVIGSGAGTGGTSAVFSGWTGVSHGSLSMYAYGNKTPTLSVSASDSVTGGGVTYINSGNVGIGTVSPGFALDVHGDSTTGVMSVKNASNGRDTFRSENAAGTRTFNVGNDGSGHANVLIRNSSGTITSYLSGSGNSYFNGGNIGIGTTSPGATLDVDGTLGVSDLPANLTSTSALVTNETIGSEVLSDPDFDTTGAWGGSSSIANGQLTKTGGGLAYQTYSGLISGGKYLVEVDVASIAGVANFYLGGTNSSSLVVGKQSFYQLGGSSNLLVGFNNGYSGTTGTVFNSVSLKLVTSASNQIQTRQLGAGAFGPTPVGAFLPLAGGTLTGELIFNNGVAETWKDNTGNTTRMMVLNSSNNAYIGPVDGYAGGDIYYGVSANVSTQVFYTGASERMRISANGNVGIGVTSPGSKLDVNGAIKTNSVFRGDTLNNSANTHNIIYRSGTTTFIAGGDKLLVQDGGNVGIGTTNPTDKLFIRGDNPNIVLYSDTTTGSLINFIDQSWQSQIKGNQGTLVFNTGGTSERMRIATNGNVGIGATSPESKLHIIDSSTSAQLRLNQSGNNDAVLGSGSNFFQIRTGSGGSSTALAILHSNQNVGIGTTNPGYKLQVSGGNVMINGGSSNNLFLSINTNYLYGDVNGVVTAGANNNFRIKTNGSERLRIIQNGKVGIGTTSPQDLLSLSSVAATSRLSIINTDGGKTILQAGISGVSNNGTSFITANSNGASESVRMVISSAGNVGIGTTSPSQKLEVAGNIMAVSSTITAYAGSTEYAQLSTTKLTINNGGGKVVINSNGDSYLNGGNVGIGTTSPSRLFTVAKGDTATDFGSHTGPVIAISQTNTTVNNQASLLFQSGNGAVAEITTKITNHGSKYGDLLFGTRSASGYTAKMEIASAGAIKFNAYSSTNQTGTPTYLLGTDASGNVVKTLTTPSPITSQAASLYDLIPNGAFTTTYAFTSTAGTYAEVMEGNDVITAAGTYSVQMYVDDYAVGGTQYREYYSGVMSWNAPDNTNDDGLGAISEIVLHRAGHAANQGMTYLRTRESGSSETNKLKLEIMGNKTYTGASNVVFKFVRLI